LTNTCVATIFDSRTNCQSIAIVCAFAGHRVKGADHLAIVLTCTVIAAITLRDCGANLYRNAIVCTSTNFVGAIHLSCSLTSTRVAGVSLGKCLTEWDRSSIVLAIARVVGTLNLTTGHAGAGVAILLSSISNIQGHSLILTFTGNRIVLAGNLSVLLALTSVASISFVEC